MLLTVTSLVLALLAIAWLIVRYYSDPAAAHPLSTFATVLALLCSMLCVLLIPLDVLSVTSSEAVDAVVVQTAYHTLFGVVAALAFVILPFSYFYVEDDGSDDDYMTARTGCFDRTVGALRNTAIFVAAILILILLALFFKPISETTKDTSDVHVWVRTMLHQWRAGALERGLTLAVGCMAVLGLLNMVLYTAYGIVALPLQLMRGSGGLEDEQLSAEYDRLANQQKRALLTARLSEETTTGRLRQKYAKELEKLRDQERLAERKISRITSMTNDWAYTLWTYLYPVRCIVGFGLLLLALSIVATLIISIVDMWLNSLCGLRCGFVMDTPTLFNPLDRILVYLSHYFPLDCGALAVLAGYLLLSSVYGIVKLGIRFAMWQVFEIRPKRTWPQALLLLCAYLMFTLLAIMIELSAMLPQYTTFGAQKFRDAATNTDVPCRQSHTHSHTASKPDGTASDTIYLAPCSSTQVSLFIHRLTLTHPLFASIFFMGHLAFVVVALVSLIVVAVKKQSVVDVAANDDEDDDDLDLLVYKESKHSRPLV